MHRVSKLVVGDQLGHVGVVGRSWKGECCLKCIFEAINTLKRAQAHNSLEKGTKKVKKSSPVRGLWSSTMAPIAGMKAVRRDVQRNERYLRYESSKKGIKEKYKEYLRYESSKKNVFQISKKISTWALSPLDIASLVQSSDPETIAPEDKKYLLLTSCLCICICICNCLKPRF